MSRYFMNAKGNVISSRLISQVQMKLFTKNYEKEIKNNKLIDFLRLFSP